jgi:hypothetical protein
MGVLLLWAFTAGQTHGKSSIAHVVKNASDCCSWAELSSYVGDASAVNTLMTMLRERADDAHWSKAILALGLIAPYSENMAVKLMGFLEAGSSFEQCMNERSVPAPSGVQTTIAVTPIESELAEAKVQVPLAVGHLLSHSKEKNRSQVVETLQKGTDPAYWRGRIRWTNEELFATQEELSLVLATQCIKGLAHSNLREAKEFLRALRSKPPVRDTGYLATLDASLRN